MRFCQFAVAGLSIVVLALLAGCGTPSFLITPVSNSSELTEEVVQAGTSWSPSKVAIIEVEGMLVNAKAGGLLQPTENSLSLFTQQLERAEADARVKAIVLRVNSPGGTVSASDSMYEMLRRFRQKTGKPIVASIQEIGASGAYYLSCAADKIVAQPTSIVGSIGVIFESLEFSGTLDKIGAKSWAITSGPLKEMGSPFKPLEPRERAVMQEMVGEYFARFIEIVRPADRLPNRPKAIWPNIRTRITPASSADGSSVAPRANDAAWSMRRDCSLTPLNLQNPLAKRPMPRLSCIVGPTGIQDQFTRRAIRRRPGKTLRHSKCPERGDSCRQDFTICGDRESKAANSGLTAETQGSRRMQEKIKVRQA